MKSKIYISDRATTMLKMGDGNMIRFRGGRYVTADPGEIAFLDKVARKNNGIKEFYDEKVVLADIIAEKDDEIKELKKEIKRLKAKGKDEFFGKKRKGMI